VVKTFSEYVSDPGAKDGKPTYSLQQPVLIHRGHSDDDDLSQRVYDTEHTTAATKLSSIASRAPGARDNIPWGNVFPLMKREDATFSTYIGVGRAANLDVCLPLRRISKFHAYFIPSANGGMVVADSGSKNGTWVDGRRLAPKTPTALRDGSLIRLGPYEFMFLGAESFRKAVIRGSLE
jgi:hypothetical protein